MNQTQTAQTQPSVYLPQTQELETQVADITALWYLACERGADIKTRAETIFHDHPGARKDPTVARRTQLALRELLGYATTPEPAPLADLPPFDPVPAPRTAAVPESTQAPERAPTSTTGPEEVQNPGADAQTPQGNEGPLEDSGEALPPEEAVPESAAPTLPPGPASSDPTAWGEGQIGSGLISGLAATLAVGDAVQLVITRTAASQVLATVVPQRLNGELAGTCRDLQSKGTPRQLDEEFLGAMGTYREARKTAREVAEELLAATRAAAASAKAAASKSAEASRKRAEDAKAAQQATLTVTPNVEGAVISLGGDKSTFTPAAGQAQPLDPGRYSLKVEAAGHDPHEESVLLKAKESKTLSVTLKTRPHGLF